MSGLDAHRPGRDVRPSNTEDAYTRLREMVLNGEIPPGTVISQVKLSRELGVSTTPLREAMRLLQAEGLLEAEHNRRSRVASLDPAELDAIYGARILLEQLGVVLSVPRRTSEDVATLHAELAHMQDAASSHDVGAWERAHRRFHTRLVAGSGDLTGLIEPIADRSERYRRATMFSSPRRAWDVGNAEHEDIVAAYEARDARQAGTLLARHLARSALTVMAQIAPEREPAAVRSALQTALADIPAPSAG